MPTWLTPFEKKLNREPAPSPQLRFWGCRPWMAEETCSVGVQLTPRLPGASGHRTEFSRRGAGLRQQLTLKVAPNRGFCNWDADCSFWFKV